MTDEEYKCARAAIDQYGDEIKRLPGVGAINVGISISGSGAGAIHIDCHSNEDIERLEASRALDQYEDKFPFPFEFRVVNLR